MTPNQMKCPGDDDDPIMHEQAHYVFKVAYDGTRYFGWQKTKEGPSIEEELEKALFTITQAETLQIQAASRTDRGVHSCGQIVDCRWMKKKNPKKGKEIDPRLLLLSLNQLLPPDIRISHIAPVHNLQFHPTLSTTGKTYIYRVSLGTYYSPLSRLYSWHIHDSNFNIEKIYEALPIFIGTKDFYGYCNQRKNITYTSTIRTIREITCSPVGTEQFPELLFSLTGDNFLYKMVRNIVGTLIWIAVGKLSLRDASLALTTATRHYAGVTAPAHGLVLQTVYYPYSLFDTDGHPGKNGNSAGSFS